MPDLPSEPSLTQLRHQARDLQRAVRSGVAEALAEVAERHPAGRPDDAAAAGFPLSAAQLIVARRYGFPSWARLRRYVEVVERYSRFPARMAAAGPDSPAEEFLCLACLRYEDDQPERWARALHEGTPVGLVLYLPTVQAARIRGLRRSSRTGAFPSAGSQRPAGRRRSPSGRATRTGWSRSRTASGWPPTSRAPART
jgi:hypothetical protein